MSRHVTVRALPGRVANTAPRGGKPIPEDRWITVQRTPWIDRLIEHHGDLEVKPEEPQSAPVPIPARKGKATDAS